MKRAEYLRLRAKIKARYERDLEALERVWAIASGYESEVGSEAVHEEVGQAATGSEEETSTGPNERNGQVKKFSLRREIEKVLSEFETNEDITQGKVRQTLEERFPRHKTYMHSASVSSALRRIAQAGDLVLISTGTGSGPNRYRKPEGVDVREEEKQEERLLES